MNVEKNVIEIDPSVSCPSVVHATIHVTRVETIKKTHPRRFRGSIDRRRSTDNRKNPFQARAAQAPSTNAKKNHSFKTVHARARPRGSIARTFITVRIPHANNASSRLVCSNAPMHKNLSITSTMGSHRVGRVRPIPPFPESLLVDSPPNTPGSLDAGRRWCPQISHVVPGACSCPHARHIGDMLDSLSDRRIAAAARSASSTSESESVVRVIF